MKKLSLFVLAILGMLGVVQAQSTCTITGTVRNPDRTYAVGVRVSVTKVAPETGTGELYSTSRIYADTNASGAFSLSVPCNSIVTLQAPVQGLTNGQAMAVGASGGDISSLVRVPSPSTVPIVVGGGGGGGVTDGDKGDIIISGTGTVYTIDTGVVTSSKILDGTIANADVSSSAAIAYSKLNLSGAILNADLAGSIDLTTKVTGALPIANGGTGTTTAANARNALLPSKSGNAGKFLRVNGAETDYEVATISGGGDLLSTNNLSDVASVSTARTNLGLAIGTNVQAYDADLTTYAGITPSANVQSLLGAADYAAMRSQLGLVIGTNVQAFDSDLTTWAGVTPGTGVATALAVATNGAGGFVTDSGTVTLTNKTISGASNTLSNIGNSSLTNSAITIAGTSTSLGGSITASAILDSIGSTRGSVLYRGASGWAILTPGTSGHFLKSQGAGADPVWDAASGGGGSPGGSTKQLQFNSAGSFGGAAGFEYQSAASPNVLITAQAATHIPLRLVGAASQSANYFNVVTSGGSPVASIFPTSDGYQINASNTDGFGGGISFGAQGGVRVSNATGALEVNGSVTRVIRPGQGTVGEFKFNGGLRVNQLYNDTTTLEVVGVSGQTTNIAEFRIGSTVYASVTKDGEVKLRSVTFSALPTVSNAALIYCSDCTVASPCASGGSGAFAKGINGAWVCN